MFNNNRDNREPRDNRDGGQRRRGGNTNNSNGNGNGKRRGGKFNSRNNGPFQKKYYVKNLTKFNNETDPEQVMPIGLEQGKLRVIPLGGVEFVGINTNVIEYGNDMMIVDMGFGFPPHKELGEDLGVDYLIPNYSYVKQNLDKLRGIVITHGHLDHIGAIPYVIEELGFPTIYAGKLAAELIREKAREFSLEDKIKIQEVTAVSRYRLGVFDISYFRVNHNIPDSFGAIIRTPQGNVIHTGDFKFDLTPYREPVTEFNKISQMGEEGVLLLMSDSTNACEKGWSDSESNVTEDLTRLINDAKGRVIASTFSTLITRMAQIIEIAHAANRRVVITGRSIETLVRIAKELGLIKVPLDAFVTKEQSRDIPDENLLILATGSQGEPNAALNRMVNGIHNDFDIKVGDTVILSSSFIPGNENKINDVIGKLQKRGAVVYHSKMMDVHASGHAAQEDHKLLLHLAKPKYLMPVHGEFTMLLGQKSTAIKVGMDPQNVILAENGTTIDFDANGYKVMGKVNAKPVLVDGNIMGDITPDVLSDRERMGEEGVIIIGIKGENLSIITKGFMNTQDNTAYINEIESIVRSNMSKNDEAVISNVSTYVKDKVGRDPMIIVSR